MSEGDGQDNIPAMLSGAVIVKEEEKEEEEDTIPPMPPGTFIKEEVNVPPMPFGAFVKQEVVVNEDDCLEDRRKRRRSDQCTEPESW